MRANARRLPADGYRVAELLELLRRGGRY